MTIQNDIVRWNQEDSKDYGITSTVTIAFAELKSENQYDFTVFGETRNIYVGKIHNVQTPENKYNVI